MRALRHPVTLAVFGAAVGSLGQAVADAVDEAGHEALTIGISGNEHVEWTPGLPLEKVYRDHGVTDVLCTVGINRPARVDDVMLRANTTESMLVNLIRPLEILQASIHDEDLIHAVAFISSNSAHIARTGSLPYCASKAALSMAVRVAARETAGDPLVYAYEPGLLDKTPMTQESGKEFSGPLHRIPGLSPRQGLDVKDFATTIAMNFLFPSHALNGATIRLDGGEQ